MDSHYSRTSRSTARWTASWDSRQYLKRTSVDAQKVSEEAYNPQGLCASGKAAPALAQYSSFTISEAHRAIQKRFHILLVRLVPKLNLDAPEQFIPLRASGRGRPIKVKGRDVRLGVCARLVRRDERDTRADEDDVVRRVRDRRESDERADLRPKACTLPHQRLPNTALGVRAYTHSGRSGCRP
jgi:hypothetical protein